MRKCFVLGAGFSKAVAKLPLTRELTKKFWDVLEKEKELGHNNRVFWGESMKKYVEKYVDPLEQENLGAILSFIDINLSSPINS